mmetsp:Transcript_4517/g.6808  ORF Transcript_4517/g.6808 Transcript_4517/m.6808 type:complete len:84 (+) Transcript_4517:2015-2266(+)
MEENNFPMKSTEKASIHKVLKQGDTTTETEETIKARHQINPSNPSNPDPIKEEQIVDPKGMTLNQESSAGQITANDAHRRSQL